MLGALSALGLLVSLSQAYDQKDYLQYRRETNNPPSIRVVTPTMQYNAPPQVQYQQLPAPQYYPPPQAPAYQPPPQYYPQQPGMPPPAGHQAPVDRGGPKHFDTAPADGVIPNDGTFVEFSDTFNDKVKAYVKKHAPGGVFLIKDETTGATRPLKLLKVRPGSITVSGAEATGSVQFQATDNQETIELDFHLSREDSEWSVASLQRHAPAAAAATAAAPGARSAPKAKAPATLAVEVTFTEPSGNQRLDGGETATLTVKVSNGGPGPAYDVRGSAAAKPPIPGLSAPAPAAFGDLKAGQSAVKTILLKSADDLAAARASLLLEIKEANGFDADPVIIEFETRPLQPPKLELTALALGGAGVVKAGEAVPLSVTVRNSGSGPAEGVSVTLSPGDQDIFLSGETQAELGTLAPGQSLRADFEFFVKKRYQGGSALPLSVTVKEGRGRFGFGPQNLGLTLGQAAPSLRVAYKGKDAPAAARADEDVDVPPASQTAPDPEAYAVVVGVEKYRDLPTVDYAARDAQAMRSYLTGSMGFLPSNVVLLQNERATLTDLATYLGPWLKDRVTRKSRVFIYYSGHGAPDPKTGESYLVPYDGNPQYAETKAFPVRTLYANLASLPTSDVIVALDSCFSGVGARSVIAKGTRPLVSVHSAPTGANTVVLSASGGDQISGSYPEGQHGLLTYFMLKGLQGSADADSDSQITTAELYSYLRPAVEDAARRQHVEQTPVLTPAPEALGSRGRRVWLKRQR